MFNKNISEIEYSDVQTFCESFGEGVRVEYKSELIKNLPKVISSFANTQGGVLLIGVKTDKVHNKVISIDGIEKSDGIEEAILSSCLQGIYPAVIPEVGIVNIPQTNNIVVIIKVYESIEAPHAIQNETRVYIRTGSITEPYELSTIDRIQFFLNRREKATHLKEQLLKDSIGRVLGLYGDIPILEPYMYMSVVPVYPYQPLISLDRLYEFKEISGAFRRIMNGACRYDSKGIEFGYNEVNQYGLIFSCHTLKKRQDSWTVVGGEKDEKLYLRFVQFVTIIADTLELSRKFYEFIGFQGNLEMKIVVDNIKNQHLIYDDRFSADHLICAFDKQISSSRIFLSDNIKEEFIELINSQIKTILWVFNCEVDLKEKIKAIISSRHYEYSTVS